MTASGIVEGLVVGVAQWWATAPGFPGLSRRSWIAATIYGALVAWFLGSVPSTMMSLGASDQGQAAAEPEGALMLVMASGMGLVAGFILGIPQWRVLRGTVPGAWSWLPANSLAWAVGMPIVFSAVDLAFASGSVTSGVAIMGVALLLTGAVVGAVHGAVLVGLANRRRLSEA